MSKKKKKKKPKGECLLAAQASEICICAGIFVDLDAPSEHRVLLSTLCQWSFIKVLWIIAVDVHGVVGAGPVGWTLVRRGWI